MSATGSILSVEDCAVDPFAADQLQGGGNLRGETSHIEAEFQTIA